MAAKPRRYFQVGGTLRSTTPSYVERPADQELFETIQKGELAYVLTPRQMGKSSLIVRTEKKCKTLGYDTSVIDLTSLGTVTGRQIDSWYIGLLNQIKEDINLSFDPSEWWKAQETTSSQRFLNFLRYVAGDHIEKQLVIFIDEIDSMLRLSFRADFFAAIRSLVNTKARDEIFAKISFVLVGVALPTDLINDNKRTPFNVGVEISLIDLSLEDSVPLIEGLKDKFSENAEKIFNRIYFWTSGQPYLTQKLCQIVLSSYKRTFTDDEIDSLVYSTFIGATNKDTNTKDIENFILSFPRKNRLLKTYQKIFDEKQVPEDINSNDQARLKIIGLVKAENNALVVRNELYKRVFNNNWINRNKDSHLIRNSLMFFATTALLIAICLSIFEYTHSIQATQSYEIITSPESTNNQRVSGLQTIFCRPFIMPYLGKTYPHKGVDAFHLIKNKNKQIELFDYQNYEQNPECLEKVIYGISPSLVGFDSTQILQSMQKELSRNSIQSSSTKNLINGLENWISGRDNFEKANYKDAIDFYDKALSFLPNNLAIIYDRTVALTKQGRPEDLNQALSDSEYILNLSSPENLQIPPIDTLAFDNLVENDNSNYTTEYNPTQMNFSSPSNRWEAVSNLLIESPHLQEMFLSESYKASQDFANLNLIFSSLSVNNLAYIRVPRNNSEAVIWFPDIDELEGGAIREVRNEDLYSGSTLTRFNSMGRITSFERTYKYPNLCLSENGLEVVYIQMYFFIASDGAQDFFNWATDNWTLPGIIPMSEVGEQSYFYKRSTTSLAGANCLMEADSFTFQDINVAYRVVVYTQEGDERWTDQDSLAKSLSIAKIAEKRINDIVADRISPVGLDPRDLDGDGILHDPANGLYDLCQDQPGPAHTCGCNINNVPASCGNINGSGNNDGG